MRFRAEQHLRRPREIRAVRECGQRLDCRAFTLWWQCRRPAPGGNADSPALSTARVCVIASKAAVGAAVRRNRAKRRLRELYRLHQAAVPANCDLLLIARAGAADWPLPRLAERFLDACRQIAAAAGAP